LETDAVSSSMKVNEVPSSLKIDAVSSSTKVNEASRSLKTDAVSSSMKVNEASRSFETDAVSSSTKAVERLSSIKFLKPVKSDSVKPSKTRRKTRWTEDETEEFYIGIRHIGLCFGHLSEVMNIYTEEELRAKYKREHKNYPERIDEAVKEHGKNNYDLDSFLEKWKK